MDAPTPLWVADTAPCSKSKECRLCVVNTRSVCNKTDIVIDHLIDFDIDIMCLTETWLTNTERHRKTIGDLTLPGFNLINVPRSFRSGGGVAIIHHSSIESKLIQTQHVASSFESMCVCMKFKGTKSPIKLVVLYRPPYSQKNKLGFNVFLGEFSNFLTSLLSVSCKLIIVGDFNVHWDDPANTENKKFRELIESFNLKQFVN